MAKMSFNEMATVVEAALKHNGIKAFVDNSNPIMIFPNIETLAQGVGTSKQAYHFFTCDPWGLCLAINGKLQSTSYDQDYYHRCLVEPLSVNGPAVETILILGAGELASVKWALKFPNVRVVDAVDIDEEIVALSMVYLQDFHQDAFKDKRVRLHYKDANDFLSQCPTAYYDRVIFDLSEPLENSPSVQAYSQETFEQIMRVMRSDGLLSISAEPQESIFWRCVSDTLQSIGFDLNVHTQFIPSFFTRWAFIQAGKSRVLLDGVVFPGPFKPTVQGQARILTADAFFGLYSEEV